MGFPRNQLTLWIASTRYWLLLVYWLIAYITLGFLFAMLYLLVPNSVVKGSDGQTKNFEDLLHYSFTTQATVGYGDYSPLGTARIMAALQALLGTAMNAVVLGATTYKFLKRTSPLVFPDILVYDPVNHVFMFRFWNGDADDLREVKWMVTAFNPQPSRTYDSIWSKVEMDFDETKLAPSLHLFAVKTKPNEGLYSKDIGTDRNPILLSPLNVEVNTVIRIEFAGFFHTTGDAFFINKDYKLYSIRCGQYMGVDNGPLQQLSPRKRAEYIGSLLNRTISTDKPDCRSCPFHQNCLLDVAVSIRKG